MAVSDPFSDVGPRGSTWGPLIDRRAVATWPRLDRAALRRCRHDPRRIAALVSRRTSLPLESILMILIAPHVSDEERATWFG
jgi:hypothetical protein